MNETQLRRRVQVFTVLAVCLLFALIIALAGQLITLGQLRATESRLEREKQAILLSTDSLEAEISRKQSQLYAEQYARERLGLIKDGESKFVISDEE